MFNLLYGKDDSKVAQVAKGMFSVQNMEKREQEEKAKAAKWRAEQEEQRRKSEENARKISGDQ